MTARSSPAARREDIVAAAGSLTGLQQLAEDLLHQYVIEYDLPPGHQNLRSHLGVGQAQGRQPARAVAHSEPLTISARAAGSCRAAAIACSASGAMIA